MNQKILFVAASLVSAISLVACSSQTGSSFDTSKSINKYSREAGSGTRECFFEGIGYKDVSKEDKWNEGVTVSSAASNADIMSKVGSDIYAIGYCSLDGISGNTSIKALDFEGVSASKETVVSGDYKLKRNFNYVVRDYSSSIDEESKNKEAVVKAFLEFMETSEGKTTISSKGGILTSEDATTLMSDVISKYSILSSSIAVTIRVCGSTSVDKIGKALNEKFLSLISNKNITIEQNQTGSGDAVSGVTTGKNGVLSDIGYLSREISDSELSSLTENNTHGEICKDAVVAIVNKDNSVVTNIEATTLSDIYKGTITKWSELA